MGAAPRVGGCEALNRAAGAGRFSEDDLVSIRPQLFPFCEPTGEACPTLLEERYFGRREIREAIAFAERGGIAVHRNLDRYDGRLSPRGFVMRKPFVHVIGLRPQLEEWGRRHGLRAEWIQPERRRRVAHYDVFGPFAQSLIDRLSS